MKKLINYFAVSIVSILMISSCTSETDLTKELNLSVKLITENPVCNHLKSAVISNGVQSSQSCIEYSFDASTKKLSLKHLNAGFNCCPESLYCQVSFRNDTIIIQEFEKHMGCKCNCLYDLDIEVSGVEPGEYQLRMIEPYLGTQKPLVFLLDIKQKNQGSFCVSRTNYPW